MVSGYLHEIDPFYWFEEALFRMAFLNRDDTLQLFKACNMAFVRDYKQKVLHIVLGSDYRWRHIVDNDCFNTFLVIGSRCNRARCFFSKCTCSRPLTEEFLGHYVAP